MKAFRLIGKAVVAVIMCVNFTACDKDDEPVTNEDGIVTNQKTLVEMIHICKHNDQSEHKSEMKFIYDSKGRLVSTISSYNDNKVITTYTWNDNTIEMRGGYTSSFILNDNGLVTGTKDDYNRVFTYNSSNLLYILSQQNRYGDLYVYSFNWDKDKLIEITNENDNETITMSYSGKTCKGYSMLIAALFDGLLTDESGLFLAHPELIGCRSSQLPDEMRDELAISYTFDKDGYVEGMILTDSDGDEDTYTFTWE